MMNRYLATIWLLVIVSLLPLASADTIGDVALKDCKLTSSSYGCSSTISASCNISLAQAGIATIVDSRMVIAGQTFSATLTSGNASSGVWTVSIPYDPVFTGAPISLDFVQATSSYGFTCSGNKDTTVERCFIDFTTPVLAANDCSCVFVDVVGSCGVDNIRTITQTPSAGCDNNAVTSSYPKFCDFCDPEWTVSYTGCTINGLTTSVDPLGGTSEKSYFSANPSCCAATTNNLGSSWFTHNTGSDCVPPADSGETLTCRLTPWLSYQDDIRQQGEESEISGFEKDNNVVAAASLESAFQPLVWDFDRDGYNEIILFSTVGTDTIYLLSNEMIIQDSISLGSATITGQPALGGIDDYGVDGNNRIPLIDGTYDFDLFVELGGVPHLVVPVRNGATAEIRTYNFESLISGGGFNLENTATIASGVDLTGTQCLGDFCYFMDTSNFPGPLAYRFDWFTHAFSSVDLGVLWFPAGVGGSWIGTASNLANTGFIPTVTRDNALGRQVLLWTMYFDDFSGLIRGKIFSTELDLTRIETWKLRVDQQSESFSLTQNDFDLIGTTVSDGFNAYISFEEEQETGTPDTNIFGFYKIDLGDLQIADLLGYPLSPSIDQFQIWEDEITSVDEGVSNMLYIDGFPTVQINVEQPGSFNLVGGAGGTITAEAQSEMGIGGNCFDVAFSSLQPNAKGFDWIPNDRLFIAGADGPNGRMCIYDIKTGSITQGDKIGDFAGDGPEIFGNNHLHGVAYSPDRQRVYVGLGFTSGVGSSSYLLNYDVSTRGAEIFSSSILVWNNTGGTAAAVDGLVYVAEDKLWFCNSRLGTLTLVDITGALTGAYSDLTTVSCSGSFQPIIDNQNNVAIVMDSGGRFDFYDISGGFAIDSGDLIGTTLGTFTGERMGTKDNIDPDRTKLFTLSGSTPRMIDYGPVLTGGNPVEFANGCSFSQRTGTMFARENTSVMIERGGLGDHMRACDFSLTTDPEEFDVGEILSNLINNPSSSDDYSGGSLSDDTTGQAIFVSVGFTNAWMLFNLEDILNIPLSAQFGRSTQTIQYDNNNIIENRVVSSFNKRAFITAADWNGDQNSIIDVISPYGAALFNTLQFDIFESGLDSGTGEWTLPVDLNSDSRLDLLTITPGSSTSTAYITNPSVQAIDVANITEITSLRCTAQGNSGLASVQVIARLPDPDVISVGIDWGDGAGIQFPDVQLDGVYLNKYSEGGKTYSVKVQVVPLDDVFNFDSDTCSIIVGEIEQGLLGDVTVGENCNLGFAGEFNFDDFIGNVGWLSSTHSVFSDQFVPVNGELILTDSNTRVSHALADCDMKTIVTMEARLNPGSSPQVSLVSSQGETQGFVFNSGDNTIKTQDGTQLTNFPVGYSTVTMVLDRSQAEIRFFVDGVLEFTSGRLLDDISEVRITGQASVDYVRITTSGVDLTRIVVNNDIPDLKGDEDFLLACDNQALLNETELGVRRSFPNLGFYCASTGLSYCDYDELIQIATRFSNCAKETYNYCIGVTYPSTAKIPAGVDRGLSGATTCSAVLGGASLWGGIVVPGVGSLWQIVSSNAIVAMVIFLLLILFIGLAKSKK